MKAKKKYFTGGRVANRAADALNRRSDRQAGKSEKSMNKAAALQAKADSLPKGIEGASRRNQAKKAILEERARNRGNIGRAQAARSTRSAKASQALRRRGEVAAANKGNRAAKAAIRSSYR